MHDRRTADDLRGWVCSSTDSSQASFFVVRLTRGRSCTQTADLRASSQCTGLAIQGRDDSGSTPRQMEAYARRTRSLAKMTELAWFEGVHLGEAGLEHMEHMLELAHCVVG